MLSDSLYAELHRLAEHCSWNWHRFETELYPCNPETDAADLSSSQRWRQLTQTLAHLYWADELISDPGFQHTPLPEVYCEAIAAERWRCIGTPVPQQNPDQLH